VWALVGYILVAESNPACRASRKIEPVPFLELASEIF
jgi:hypothetical protein